MVFCSPGLVYMTTQVLSLRVEITLKFGVSSHIMDWHRYLVCKYIRWVLLNFPSCPIVWKYRSEGLAAINSGCQDAGMITQITATMHRAIGIDWPADDRQAIRSIWRFLRWATGLLGLWTLQYLNREKKNCCWHLLCSHHGGYGYNYSSGCQSVRRWTPFLCLKHNWYLTKVVLQRNKKKSIKVAGPSPRGDAGT